MPRRELPARYCIHTFFILYDKQLSINRCVAGIAATSALVGCVWWLDPHSDNESFGTLVREKCLATGVATVSNSAMFHLQGADDGVD